MPGYRAEDYDEELDLDDPSLYADIEAKHAPQFSLPLASSLLVDGAPVVGNDKKTKLVAAMKKVFDARGFTVQEIHMPMSSETSNSAQSKGVLFVILKDPSTAAQAAAACDGHKFDKRHTLGVRTFDEVERLNEQVNNDFEEPAQQEYRDREHLRSWLGDAQSRDQLSILRGDDLTVSYFNRNGSLAVEPSAERNKWTESYTAWSPQGMYLATIHGPGVALWGGSSFSRINRFAHPEATLIDFSPNERYLITWSRRPLEIPQGALNNPNFPFTEADEGNHICVWEILTGKMLRSFPMISAPSAQQEEGKITKTPFTWPVFKWSGDEKYFARITPGSQISVYEAPEMGLLGKKSIKIDGVADFEWRPLGAQEREEDNAREEALAKGDKVAAERENMIAYWTPEIANQPARVTLMSLPARTALRSKNLVNVSDCKIHWQSNGDFLCVKVDRHTKTKKTLFCNLEIFRVREKGLPVESIDIKDTVTAFAWEPKGDRFALITTNDPNIINLAPGATYKTDLRFYQLDSRKGDFRLLKTFEGKSCNTVFWSPKGRHLVAATLGSSSKFDMEFWDMDLEGRQEVGGHQSAAADLAAGIQLLATIEHYGMTAIEWDPSGRYVTVTGSMWSSSMEPGYGVYSFSGTEITKNTLDKMKQVLWRPRPPTLLTRADQKKIRRNLRDYSKQFEELDAAEESNVSKELLDQRRRLVSEWNAWRARVKAQVEQERQELGKGVASKSIEAVAEEELEKVEEWTEEVIEEVEEVIVES